MKILVSLIVVMHIYLLVQGTTIVEEPSVVKYHPVETILPIELTCDVSPGVAWLVNGTSYILNELQSGSLPGHNVSGRNILITSIPMNNSQYVCSDAINNGEVYRILVAGIPAMVPDVTVDNNTTSIDGNHVTLTLSWGEPFDNCDPIVNYTVSCSGVDACPENFTTDNNSTINHVFTDLIPMTTYTFSVIATNSIGSGEAGIATYATPGIDQVTGVTLTCKLMGDLSDYSCTVMWNPVTQGDITGYQVYYNGTMMNVDSSTTTLTFTAPPLSDGVFTGTIVVMVTAVNRYGTGPASDLDNAVIPVLSSSVTSATVEPISSNFTIIVTCTIHPDSTADQCEAVAMADGRMTKTDTAPILSGTSTVTVNELECGVTYTITAGGVLNNGSLVGPRFSLGNIEIDECSEGGKSEGDNEGCGEGCFGGIIGGIVAVVTGGIILLAVIGYIRCTKKDPEVTDPEKGDKTDKKSKGNNTIQPLLDSEPGSPKAVNMNEGTGPSEGNAPMKKADVKKSDQKEHQPGEVYYADLQHIPTSGLNDNLKFSGGHDVPYAITTSSS